MENHNPVHVFATWKVKEGQITSVLNLLSIVQDKSLMENGNLFYKIHQSNSDENTLVLFEGYTNEVAVTEHRNSSHFQELVFDTVIHRNTKLGEAPSYGETIVMHDASSKGSINYLNFAREILQKNNLTKIANDEKKIKLDEL